MGLIGKSMDRGGKRICDMNKKSWRLSKVFSNKLHSQGTFSIVSSLLNFITP